MQLNFYTQHFAGADLDVGTGEIIEPLSAQFELVSSWNYVAEAKYAIRIGNGCAGVAIGIAKHDASTYDSTPFIVGYQPFD